MKTIMVVEDERTIADMLCAVLEEEGYNILLAHNGREGLEQLERQLPDLILCDVMMPILDGRAFYKHIQAHPTYRTIPIVFISAVPEVVEDGEGNYAALLRKPFNLSVLLSTVREILDSRDG